MHFTNLISSLARSRYFFLCLLSSYLLTSTVFAQDTSSSSLHYLALGDSYTIGESVEEKERWPIQLVHQLAQNGILFSPPTLVAKTGWTSDELLLHLGVEKLEDSYDMVSLLIGVNNQYRGRSVDDFIPEFDQLLCFALNKAEGNTERVFVLSIPDWGAMPFAKERDRTKIAYEIDVFNAAISRSCEALGVRFFDITPISRQAPNDASLVASDALHPSGEMYARWVAQILPSYKFLAHE